MESILLMELIITTINKQKKTKFPITYVKKDGTDK